MAFIDSIVLNVIVYLLVYGAGIFYMARLARAGPPANVEMREPNLAERPARRPQQLSGAACSQLRFFFMNDVWREQCIA